MGIGRFFSFANSGKLDSRSRSQSDSQSAEARDSSSMNETKTTNAGDATTNVVTNDVPVADGSDDQILIARLKTERDDLGEQLKRAQADFVNYQRRSRAQADSDRQFAIIAFAMDLLNVLDNFERAASAAKTASSGGGQSIAEGVEMVQKQLLATLAKHGVHPIQALHQPFDPNMHEALIQRPDPKHPAGVVVEDLIKGYTHHDRVLRPSKVAVSAAS